MDRAYHMDNGGMTYGLLASRLLDTYEIGFYDSYYNNEVDRSHRELALVATGRVNYYTNLGGRAMLMQLLGVRFYARPSNDMMPVPYGYSFDGRSIHGIDNHTYSLFENEQPSLMAIGYERAISKNTYEALTPLERQEALLQAVVLDDGEAENGVADKQASVAITSRELPISVAATDKDISIADGLIQVRRAGASLELACERAPGTELYLFANHLKFVEYNERACYQDAAWESLTDDERQGVLAHDAIWQSHEYCAVRVETDYSIGHFNEATNDNHMYGGHDTWLWNAGYSDVGTHRVKLMFVYPGEYTYDELCLLAQPMTTLDEVKKQRGFIRVENLRSDIDSISCDVDSTMGGYLFLSVPYANEWDASIDGVDVPVLRADTAFMAVRVPEGETHLVLSYVDHTAWQHVLSLIVVALVAIVYMRGNRLVWNHGAGGDHDTWTC